MAGDDWEPNRGAGDWTSAGNGVNDDISISGTASSPTGDDVFLLVQQQNLISMMTTATNNDDGILILMVMTSVSEKCIILVNRLY